MGICEVQAVLKADEECSEISRIQRKAELIQVLALKGLPRHPRDSLRPLRVSWVQNDFHNSTKKLFSFFTLSASKVYGGVFQSLRDLW